MEMLTVMVGLGVVLVLGTTMLSAGFRLHKAAGVAQQRLIGRSLLADQFRADVGQAIGVLESAARWHASSNCLILRLAGKKIVIYSWGGKELERWELVGSRTTSRQRVGLDSGCGAVTFARLGQDGKLLVLQLHDSGAKVDNPRQEIAAALGGDSQ
jgi:hypothetical protein